MNGYRNFATSDASANLFPLGIVIGGEELHNNWCRCAEQSGIDAIADFSMRLRRYA